MSITKKVLEIEEVVKEIKNYHYKNWYKNKDLYDIVDGISKKINTYLYDYKNGKNKGDFDI